MLENRCIQIGNTHFLFFDGRKCSLYSVHRDKLCSADSCKLSGMVSDVVGHLKTENIPGAESRWLVRDVQISIGDLEEQNISIIYETDKPGEDICVLYSAMNLLNCMGYLRYVDQKAFDSRPKEEKICADVVGNSVKCVKWSQYSSKVMGYVQHDNQNSYSLYVYCTTNKNRNILVTKGVQSFIQFCWGDPANSWLKYSLTYFNKDYLLKICYIIPKSYVFSTMERISLISTLVSENAQKFNSCKGKGINEKEFDVKGVAAPTQDNFDIFWVGTDLYINQNTKVHIYSFPEICNWKYEKTAAEKISFFSKVESLNAVLKNGNTQNLINMNFFQLNNRYFSFTNSQKAILYEFKDGKHQEVARLNELSLPDDLKGIIPNMNLIVIFYKNSFRFCLYSHGIVAEVYQPASRIGNKPYFSVSQEDIEKCHQRVEDIKLNRQQLNHRQEDIIRQKESIREFYEGVHDSVPEINSKIHESIKSLSHIFEKEDE